MCGDDNFLACETDITAVTEATMLPGNSYQMCDFCNKLVSPDDLIETLERLSGPIHFFCEFCLRQSHNTRDKKNILLLSFRGLIAYLYYESYLSHKNITFSEIEDLVSDHVVAGLKNPVFAYEHETMLWHVDFGRVGNTKKKLPIEHVKNTVISILTDLQLPVFVQGVQWSKLETKYVDAIDEFYHKRSRPQNRRLLVPTFKGCGPAAPKGQGWDKHKDFVKHNMLVHSH